MTDETPIRWTRERRRLGDGGDLHPFLSAAAWATGVTLSGLAAWLFYADGDRAPMWAALCLGNIAFVVAYPFLLYAHWTGAFYEREREEPALPTAANVPTVRPFVASANAPTTLRVGAFQLSRKTWAELFQIAERNGGRLTRDAADDVLPRQLYRNWQDTLDELQRLGLTDAQGRVTAEGWNFYREVSPHPVAATGPARGTSTHARRTHGAHEPDLTPVGEAG